VIRVLYHADIVNQAEDFAEMKELLFMVDPENKLNLSLTCYEHLEDCLSSARSEDVVVLDWGGLSMGGMSSFIDHYERMTEKAIQDKPSVTFVFWETMSGFYDPSLYSYPNVKAIDRTASLEEFEKLFKSLT
jgi:hypothetical protein